MAYNDFSLERVEKVLGVIARPIDLFDGLVPSPVPDWLRDILARGMRLALVSEKARSEFIVGPILLAVMELSGDAISILSGQRLDAAPEQGLVGECDFLLAASPPVPILRSPLVAIVEAKKHDIEAGIGQCVAQMVGARIFNDREGRAVPQIYGCVTTGQLWQFLRLEGEAVGIDRALFYINNVGLLLAAWRAVLERCLPIPAP